MISVAFMGCPSVWGNVPRNVVQFNGGVTAFNVMVPLVTPPPAQSSVPTVVNLPDTVAFLPHLGSVGLNNAVPVTVLHIALVGGDPAPAWTAGRPTGSTIAQQTNNARSALITSV